MKNIWLVFVFLSQSFIVGCASNAWDKYPINIPPDNNCRMGGPEGFTRYFIWKCLDNKRVVISQTSAAFARFSANKYESACDNLTEIEIKILKANYSLKCEVSGDRQTIDPLK